MPKEGHWTSASAYHKPCAVLKKEGGGMGASSYHEPSAVLNREGDGAQAEGAEWRECRGACSEEQGGDPAYGALAVTSSWLRPRTTGLAGMVACPWSAWGLLLPASSLPSPTRKSTKWGPYPRYLFGSDLRRSGLLIPAICLARKFTEWVSCPRYLFGLEIYEVGFLSQTSV